MHVLCSQTCDNDKTRFGGEKGVFASVFSQAEHFLFQLILTQYKHPDLHLSTYSSDTDANAPD